MVYNVGPFFEKCELGESDEEELDSGENDE